MANWTARTLAEVGRFFDVKQTTVKGWRAAGMPGEDRKYPLDKIAQWLRASGPWRPTRKAAADPDLVEDASPDSPELERYRGYRADLAEMERDERRGKLLSTERARELAYSVGDLWRSIRRRLVKRFGRGAGELVDEGLRDLRSVVDHECGPDSS